MGEEIALVLAGDVMTGRGVDQVLAHPGDPDLVESYVTDARTYVSLAERANGPVPQPVEPTWPWGASLAAMDEFGPAVRVMNLETSITRSQERAPGKAVHYRMSPDNLEVLRVAGVDVWALANNHVLDHGLEGLLDTLELLRASGLHAVGAGANEAEAWRPLVVAARTGGRRVVVASVGHWSSGVPRGWAATPSRPGLALLPDLANATADEVVARLREGGLPGDVRVVSVHWGSNWGYEIPAEQRRFAHRLVDGGVHVVHGHSSHHPRPLEIYRGCLVLYGCGDLVNDYEGISGYEEFRDVRLLYLARLAGGTGRLASLRMVPLRARRLRLERASTDDARWLASVLDEASRELQTRVALAPDEVLEVHPG